MAPEKRSGSNEEAEMAATQWELDVDQPDPEVDIPAIVSELEGEPLESLPPVHDTVDSLLTQLFSDPPPAKAQAMIQFTYHDYRIDVQQSGIATFMKIDDVG